jgi:large subunit ribosomal protein L9
MEVILKQDVPKLGYADEIVKVRNGYGMNYLIPQGLAVIANDTTRKIHAETMKQRAHKLGKLKESAEKVAQSLEGVVLTIPAKVGENGKLFGSVTSQNLVDVLKKMGYNIERKQIVMPDENVKFTGTYTADLLLHREVKSKVTFEVTEKEK